MTTHTPDPYRIPLVRALVELSAVDLLYADQYLDRAEVMLPGVCTRQQYLAARRDHESIPRLTNELRQATERQDWQQVHTVAQQAAQARQRVAAKEEIVSIADAVYGPRLVQADAVALALNGVVAYPTANLVRTRVTILEQLRFLSARDKERAPFYHQRIGHFENLQVFTDEHPGAMMGGAELQARVLEAIEKADFVQAQRLADTLVGEGGGQAGRFRAPRPRESRVRELAAELPIASMHRVRELGLTVETLPPIPELNEYLSCCCADRATLPESPLSETHRKPQGCTCGHACPPDVRESLRDNLDLLMLHPFISSAGTRYLPWFGPETLLIETFPETAPDARTGLLEALGLPRRRGLARLLIEDATRTRTAAICKEMGLDPIEFTVACVPFDAYLQLASQHGWGRQRSWTHFDGYQVTRDLHLRALVGGDVRYGGPDDLCGVTRSYETERLTARFAVLRRQRFLVRDGDAPQP